MSQQLRKIKISATLIAFLSGISVAEAIPNKKEGFSFGIGAGAKLLSLKNVATQNPTGPAAQRSHDAMASASSPVIGIYARKYFPDLLWLPSFLGVDFEYLTQMQKKSLYANFNAVPGIGLDTGYQYRERWDARAMVGAQIFDCNQVDFWAQVGLQVTNFDYAGLTTELPGTVQQRFPMHNNLALAPAGGLEARFSQPNLVANGIVTDFIVGWLASYRNAFRVQGTSTGNNAYDFAMSSNWSHTFGLKVMFRY